ncbi:tRNA (adenine(37)-N6)-methyltransferase-like [Argopecten irradians]|uniref:tRNA (adenine(37)-N6)-methyltransferase-like n=1 Tax=Argopecten irradians TaxID=31199 RepID=UPI003724B387
MKPIGVVNSLFTYKNGTPRQPSVCDMARGSITISKEIFNTPEHSLDGIQQYSHIWIIFEFHKNNNQYTKAKVKPPRLDGRRVGLFSTRSPYRPNPIGLTLAKLERVEGAKLHISGIDILDGSPVLDIKPYIPSYDSPGLSTAASTTPTMTAGDTDQHCDLSDDDQAVDASADDRNLDRSVDDNSRTVLSCQKQDQVCGIRKDCCTEETVSGNSELRTEIDTEVLSGEQTGKMNDTKVSLSSKVPTSDDPTTKAIDDTKCSVGKVDITGDSIDLSKNSVIKSNRTQNNNPKETDDASKSSVPGSSIKTANWVKKPPIDTLTVRFTQTVEKQLSNFSTSAEDLDYRLEFLESANEAHSAICKILTEDPRSVYRRQSCPDSLYFFVVDKVHVTCWFDENLVEVVRIKPVLQVKHLQNSK